MLQFNVEIIERHSLNHTQRSSCSITNINREKCVYLHDLISYHLPQISNEFFAFHCIHVVNVNEVGGNSENICKLCGNELNSNEYPVMLHTKLSVIMKQFMILHQPTNTFHVNLKLIYHSYDYQKHQLRYRLNEISRKKISSKNNDNYLDCNEYAEIDQQFEYASIKTIAPTYKSKSSERRLRFRQMEIRRTQRLTQQTHNQSNSILKKNNKKLSMKKSIIQFYRYQYGNRSTESDNSSVDSGIFIEHI
ncbi:hypothetical protein SNEBB_006077 [Seison nebaliae]|nr:hypothetical protein SNEBB_006077 [Seison nebaliae]